MDGAEGPKDLSDKMFIFPQETASAHVKLTLDQESFTAVTVCQRFFTDLQRNYALFSLATPKHPDAFLTYMNQHKLVASVQNSKVYFDGVDCAPNKWHSICTTWDSASGLVQVWLDRQHLAVRHIPDKTITGKPIITLGQDQDRHGSGFNAKESFVGMMTDVHMWDHELSDHEIDKYMKKKNYTPGNVLNWAALDYEIKGNVIVRNTPNICIC